MASLAPSLQNSQGTAGSVGWNSVRNQPPLMRKTPPKATKTKQFSCQKTDREDGSSDGREPSQSSGLERSLPGYYLFTRCILKL